VVAAAQAVPDFGIVDPSVNVARQLRPARATRRPSGLVVLVLLIGLLITAALSWTSWRLNQHNETQLLERQTQQIGLVLSAAVPSTKTPLATAAQIARATNGSASSFGQYMAPEVGTTRQFVSAMLWERSSGVLRPVARVGSSPYLAPGSPATLAFLARSFHSSTFEVTSVIRHGLLRLEYAYALPGPQNYAVFAESAVPADRQSAVAKNSAFADLNYAIYLGRTQRSPDLLTTDFSHLPVRGATAKVVVPFGDTVLTTVTAATAPLGGTLPERLPWLFALLGLLLSAAAALTAQRLVQRRRIAEYDTAEIGKLYGELGQLFGQQRTIAETLQHALLPSEAPDVAGMEFAMRYLPGARGVEIGGDWYSVVPIDETHFAFVIGDVSGRGLSAATVMAGLRYSIRAYALEGYSPTTILEKCASQLLVGVDGHFATVLVGVGDVTARELTLANAGHLNPLLIDGDASHFVTTSVGVPLGVIGGRRYESTTVSVPPGATLLAFTDGLVERRGEILDAGLGRLQQAARGGNGLLDDLLTKVIADLSNNDSEDDIAILGLRWTS
jgi:serine phosphatase RsbU (regulator of sigma subunit)